MSIRYQSSRTDDSALNFMGQAGFFGLIVGSTPDNRTQANDSSQ